MNKKTIEKKINFYINAYVFDKREYVKAKNYYNGIRDTVDFAFIEDNYGIDNPIDLKFSSLIRLRVDILVGLLMADNINYDISTIDPETQQKEQNEIKKIKEDEFVKFLDEALFHNETGKPYDYDTMKQKLSEKEAKYFSKDFVSKFRKAAQMITEFYTTNSLYDLYSIVEKLAYSLFLTGEFGFYEMPIKEGTYPIMKPCLVENLYFSKPTDTYNIEESDAIVYIKYMTKRAVLMDLGQYMTKTQIADFLKDQDINISVGGSGEEDINFFDRYDDINISETSRHIPDFVYDEYSVQLNDTVKVFHTQFKNVEKVDTLSDTDIFMNGIYNFLGKKKKSNKVLKEKLYEGYKIGTKYFVGLQEVEDAKRNVFDGYKVNFSYHGISFNNRNKNPVGVGYSLIGLQDMKDILIYFRNNLIANSGVPGSRINIAAIPKFFGSTPMQRLLTFMKKKKQGVEAYDMSMPGAKGFDNYGDFNAMIDGPGLQAIDYTINNIDIEADNLCGINPQVRGQMEARVSENNVKTGMKYVSYANKKYTHALDRGIENILLLLLDNTKMAFPNGFSGVYNKGADKIAFNLLPQDYSPVYYIVSVTRKEDNEVKRQHMKEMINAFTQNNLIDPSNATRAIVSDNLQELESMTLQGLEAKKKENDTLKKMSEQLNQLDNAYKELMKVNEQQQKNIQKLEKETSEMNKEKIKHEKDKLNLEREKIESEIEYKKNNLKQIEKRTELEKYEVDTIKGNAREVVNIDNNKGE